MVLYWDLIVASTILVNYSFVKRCLFCLRKGCLVAHPDYPGHKSSFAFYLLFPGELLLRYTVGIWMDLRLFRATETKTIQIAGLYVLNYAFIGSLVIFDIQSLFWIIILLFYIVVLYLIINFKIGINQANLTYDVIILPEKHLKAYLDTGNLSMFEGKPLVFGEKWKMPVLITWLCQNSFGKRSIGNRSLPRTANRPKVTMFIIVLPNWKLMTSCLII